MFRQNTPPRRSGTAPVGQDILTTSKTATTRFELGAPGAALDLAVENGNNTRIRAQLREGMRNAVNRSVKIQPVEEPRNSK